MQKLTQVILTGNQQTDSKYTQVFLFFENINYFTSNFLKCFLEEKLNTHTLMAVAQLISSWASFRITILFPLWVLNFRSIDLAFLFWSLSSNLDKSHLLIKPFKYELICSYFCWTIVATGFEISFTWPHTAPIFTLSRPPNYWSLAA